MVSESKAKQRALPHFRDLLQNQLPICSFYETTHCCSLWYLFAFSRKLPWFRLTVSDGSAAGYNKRRFTFLLNAFQLHARNLGAVNEQAGRSSSGSSKIH